MAGWIIALVVIGAIVLLAIGIYNRLVGLRQNCEQGLADIDAQLRQRHDFIPNIVETVRGYASHEKSTLNDVVMARSRAVAATGVESGAAEAQLSGAIGNLLALAENYPQLKASANFQTLQYQLGDVEDKLAASRRAYNSATADYNGAVQAFPAVLFAGALGFRQRDFHRLDGDEVSSVGATPEVRF